MREPLGALGTVLVPVIVFVAMGKVGARLIPESQISSSRVFRVDVPVFAAVLISVNAVLSLVSIISIYREGGILKRLRATPLRPQTILTAHVLVKLFLTAATLILMLVAGKRYYPTGATIPRGRLYTCTSHFNMQHPVDRVSDRQHSTDGEIRAADWRNNSLSDDRAVWSLCAAGDNASRDALGRALASADLCCIAASGGVARG